MSSKIKFAKEPLKINQDDERNILLELLKKKQTVVANRLSLEKDKQLRYALSIYKLSINSIYVGFLNKEKNIHNIDSSSKDILMGVLREEVANNFIKSLNQTIQDDEKKAHQITMNLLKSINM